MNDTYLFRSMFAPIVSIWTPAKNEWWDSYVVYPKGKPRIRLQDVNEWAARAVARGEK